MNDPTLLFVNAGMAPLKPYFLGEALPPAADLCNVQPCVRTIDIADVGDRHHLTFFEMLGSWSIDHYFKERAVELAFELLTGGFGFAPGELYVTVYQGSEELGIPPDDISAAAWQRAGISADHIVYLGDEDNFWSAGDTGPCGPCTEVFYDTGAEHGPQYRPGGEFDSAGRYIEIWNAGVFMEFNRRPGGALEPLRFTSVDTGSGLERMAMVLQGRESVYETDLLAPIVAAARVGTGRVRPPAQRDIRLVADHVRASVFILGEGVAPSNEGRGYIPRRLLRTAIATATQAGAGSFDLGQVAGAAIDQLAGSYPRLGRGPGPDTRPARPRAARLRPGRPARPGPARRAGRHPRLRDQRRGRVRAVRHARDAGGPDPRLRRQPRRLAGRAAVRRAVHRAPRAVPRAAGQVRRRTWAGSRRRRRP